MFMDSHVGSVKWTFPINGKTETMGKKSLL